jgi:hypothetical protein
MMLAFLPVAPAPAGSEVIAVASFDSVLAHHLRDGRVDYAALARSPGALERFLADAATAEPERFGREEQMAFWINVYNARVLEGVIRRPGLGSVLDPGKVLGVPTLAFFRERARTARKDRSLNDIEHGILRAQFADPRVHFVLNCASASCPELPPRAVTAADLDSVLEAARDRFLADSRHNRVAGNTIELSSIFKWYAKDFEAEAGSVRAWVARHWRGPETIATVGPVRYLPYDWSLNGSW